jgi:hypothetical protein
MTKMKHIVKINLDEVTDDITLEGFEDMVAARAGYPGQRDKIWYDLIDVTADDTMYFNVTIEKSPVVKGIIRVKEAVVGFFGSKSDKYNEEVD